MEELSRCLAPAARGARWVICWACRCGCSLSDACILRLLLAQDRQNDHLRGQSLPSPVYLRRQSLPSPSPLGAAGGLSVAGDVVVLGTVHVAPPVVPRQHTARPAPAAWHVLPRCLLWHVCKKGHLSMAAANVFSCLPLLSRCIHIMTCGHADVSANQGAGTAPALLPAGCTLGFHVALCRMPMSMRVCFDIL